MSNPTSAFDCDHCGHRIGAKAIHFVADEATPPVVICGRCLNAMRGTKPLHVKYYPDCPVDWHDMHDHPLTFATRASVARALELLAASPKDDDGFAH